MRGLAALASMAALVIVYYICAQALTSPELTARYNARTQAQLQAEKARQQAQMVQAQEAGKTSRVWAQTWETWGVYGTSAAGVAVVAFVGGWAVVEWQRQRTRRHDDLPRAIQPHAQHQRPAFGRRWRVVDRAS